MSETPTEISSLSDLSLNDFELVEYDEVNQPLLSTEANFVEKYKSYTNLIEK
jgi:hypothetical protein